MLALFHQAFGKAKMEVEAVRQANLTRGAEYKAELEEMKEMAAQQREEWMQFGHELTVQHGPEQAERTKARLAETAEAKAEMGQTVKGVGNGRRRRGRPGRRPVLDQRRQLQLRQRGGRSRRRGGGQPWR